MGAWQFPNLVLNLQCLSVRNKFQLKLSLLASSIATTSTTTTGASAVVSTHIEAAPEIITGSSSRGTSMDSQLLKSLCRDDGALLTHAQKIDPRYTLQNLVLPPVSNRKFLEALYIARHKNEASYKIGWREKHQKGHNVVLVFNRPVEQGKRWPQKSSLMS